MILIKLVILIIVFVVVVTLKMMAEVMMVYVFLCEKLFNGPIVIVNSPDIEQQRCSVGVFLTEK